MKYWTFILLWPLLRLKSENAQKIVPEWLPTSHYWIESVTSNGIFCHKGSAKTIQTLWWTLQIHIKVISGDVIVYSGGFPEAVFDNYEYSAGADSKIHALNINPFNTACVAVNFTNNSDNKHAKHNEYRIGVLFINVDRWRVMLMTAGIIVIFTSKFLSRNPVFFYLSVSVLTIMFLLVPILYFFCQRSVHQCVAIGVLVTIVDFFLKIYDRSFWTYYTLVAGVFGFLVAYRIGPPEHPRSKQIMMWAFQVVGVVLIRWSSWYEDASLVITVIALGITYILPCIKKEKRNGELKIDVEQQNNAE